MYETPADLEAFLMDSAQLAYDAESCDVGRVVLVPLYDLCAVQFPVETTSFPNFDEDPNYPNVNSYLVTAFNLTAECNDDYRPEGILIWLPVEQRYGFWDDSHCTISMFSESISWADIVASPQEFLNACCGGDELELETLVPWNDHPHHGSQIYDPIPLEDA